MSTIAIPAAILAALIGMAKTHVEDIETGLEDGTYDATDNQDLPAKQKALTEAEAMLTSGAKSGSSIEVRHWGGYSDPSCLNTHQIDIYDHRQQKGQLYVDLSPAGGSLDDLFAVVLEINSNPLNDIEHVPCAHVHFGGDKPAVTLFKIGNRVLMRPEIDISIGSSQQRINGAQETLYWIG